MAKGDFVGEIPCPCCEGTITVMECEKAPKVWGWCAGGPNQTGARCGSRIFFGLAPSRDMRRRRAEASRAAPPETDPDTAPDPTPDQEPTVEKLPTRPSKPAPATKPGRRRSGIGIGAFLRDD